MFPGFIINQIRQREEEEQAKRQITHVELPLPLPVPEGSRAPDCDEESERGVIIIDLVGD